MEEDPPQTPDKSPGSGSAFLTGGKLDERDREGVVGKTDDEDTAYDQDGVDDGEGVERSGA
jgi:hypothetical protein